MTRLLHPFLIGFLLAGIPLTGLPQSNPFQGVYDGEMWTAAASTGFKAVLYPARLTVLPDGNSIIITEQLHNSVATIVIKGEFKSNLFEGFTRGRFNPPNYVPSAHYRIRFNRHEARIEEIQSTYKPPGFDDSASHAKHPVFYRVRS